MKFGINSKVNYQGTYRKPKKLQQKYAPHLETLDEEPEKPLAAHTVNKSLVHTPNTQASSGNKLGIILVATAVAGYLLSKNLL